MLGEESAWGGLSEMEGMECLARSALFVVLCVLSALVALDLLSVPHAPSSSTVARLWPVKQGRARRAPSPHYPPAYQHTSIPAYQHATAAVVAPSCCVVP